MHLRYGGISNKRSCSNLARRPHHRRTWTVQSYSPGGADVYLNLTHDCLGPLKSISQMAPQLVRPFLHSTEQRVPILHNGCSFPPKNCPFAWEDLDPHLMRGLFGPRGSKQHLDQLSSFCRAHNCDRLTDRPRYSVYNNNNTNICNARSVSKHTESEAQAVTVVTFVTIGHIYVCSTVMLANNDQKCTV